jgi:hypothetical protein
MATGDKTVQAFLDELYGAAVESDGRWDQAGMRLAEAMGAQTGVLWMTDDLSVMVLVAGGCLSGTELPYVEYYHKTDVWTTHGMRQPKLEGLLGQEIIPQREFIRSEFYTDFASQLGMCFMVGAVIPINSGASEVAGIATHRPEDA